MSGAVYLRLLMSGVTSSAQQGEFEHLTFMTIYGRQNQENRTHVEDAD